MSDISWRDIAWLFEGEGSVGYYRAGKGFALHVRMNMSNRPLLNEIQSSVSPNGHLIVGSKPGSFTGGVLHRRGSWTLGWYGKDAITALRSMIDHLPETSEKKPQMRLALRNGSMAEATAALAMKNMKRKVVGKVA